MWRMVLMVQKRSPPPHPLSEASHKLPLGLTLGYSIYETGLTQDLKLKKKNSSGKVQRIRLKLCSWHEFKHIWHEQPKNRRKSTVDPSLSLFFLARCAAGQHETGHQIRNRVNNENSIIKLSTLVICWYILRLLLTEEKKTLKTTIRWKKLQLSCWLSLTFFLILLHQTHKS